MAGDVPVTVVRADVRRLNLRVRPDGTVRLSIPRRAGLDVAQAFLDGHAGWLARRLACRDAAERRRGRDEAAGLAPLWGRLQALPEGGTATELWRSALRHALPDAVARGEAAVGTRASAWQLRDMRTRWGSCTPGTGRIRLALRLAAYPPLCLDYVVAHELTHLLEPSHNARFHALLSGAFPREAQARRLLSEDPGELASATGDAAGGAGA